MNVNLATMIARHTLNTMPLGDAETLQEEIDEHAEIMRGAGFNVIGPAVLVPEGGDYRGTGSYQVWFPCIVESDVDNVTVDTSAWVYVDTEGRAILVEELPEAEEMRNR